MSDYNEESYENALIELFCNNLVWGTQSSKISEILFQSKAI